MEDIPKKNAGGRDSEPELQHIEPGPEINRQKPLPAVVDEGLRRIQREEEKDREKKDEPGTLH